MLTGGQTPCEVELTTLNEASVSVLNNKYPVVIGVIVIVVIGLTINSPVVIGVIVIVVIGVVLWTVGCC